MQYERSSDDYGESEATPPAVDVALEGREQIHNPERGNDVGSLAVGTESVEDVMTAPTQKPFEVLREFPIDDPVDRTEYRRYRIEQALRRLPADASDDLKTWVVEAVTDSINRDQGVTPAQQ